MRSVLFILFFFLSSLYLKAQDFYDLDLNLYDQYVCVGDTVVVNFPSGDFSIYNDFTWYFEGQYLSNDSTISIFEEGLYEFEIYGLDTLFAEFELTLLILLEFELTFVIAVIFVCSVVKAVLLAEDNQVFSK